MKYFKSTALFIVLLFIWSCANPVPPTGGPKDEIAPQIVKAESTPNGLTNYIPEETDITFDEFVVLRNPARNIIISPPVDPKPEFLLNGKTLVIDWTEADTLRSNTTYTVNLANAVEDLNEGNPLTDFTFAFSTGPTLDSLQWQLSVADAQGKAQEGVTVMLYTDLRDSVVSQQLPYYFAKTNASGIAKFDFLKEGTYKVFALKDDNLTLKYDLPGEAIGFFKAPLQIPTDTSSQRKQLLLFTPSEEIILSEPPFYSANKVVFLFTSSDTTIQFDVINDEQVYGYRWNADSLLFYPKKDVDDSIRFRWLYKEDRRDYSIAPPDSFQNTSPKPIESELSFLRKTALISWSTPLKRPDDSVFFTIDTSGQKHFFNISQHDPLQTKLKVSSKTMPENGRILIQPDALHGFYGGENKDSLFLTYKVVKKSELGELSLQFSQASVDTPFIARLIQNEKTLKKQYFKQDTSYNWVIDNLRPGNYSIHIIVDENKNGKQDEGNYWKQQQPELPVEYKLPKLRANWTLEEEIKVSNAIKVR